MIDTPAAGGSAVRASSAVPAVCLARLLDCLADALAPAEGRKSGSQPLFAFDGARLTVHIPSVIRRLHNSEKFQSAFVAAHGSAFARNLRLPPFGTTARMGGKLAEDPGALAKAVSKLRNRTAHELDSALQGADLSGLVMESVQAALAQMAQTMRTAMPENPGSAPIVPLSFGEPSRNPGDGALPHPVARVLTAVETIEDGDLIGALCSGVRSYLRTRDMDEEDIEDACREIRTRAAQAGSQEARFIEFLEDEALARVRLQVTMELMQAVADSSASDGLKEYVARVRACYGLFASPQARAFLELNPSADYGQASVSDFGEHLRKALFYNCLPLWAQGSAQLYEDRRATATGLHIVREVSYRFRVNGTNPETRQSAFLSRLRLLSERLGLVWPELAAPAQEPCEQPVGEGQVTAPASGHVGSRPVARDVAELVFLYLVIPGASERLEGMDLPARAELIQRHLRKTPRKTLQLMLERLHSCSATMDRLARELIAQMRRKGERIVLQAARALHRYTVSVHRGVIDWEALHSLLPGSGLLISNALGHEHTLWFKHLSVTSEPVVAASLASFVVKTELTERPLHVRQAARTLPMLRTLTQPMVAMRMIPVARQPKEQCWSRHGALSDAFAAPCGVDILYDCQSLQMPGNAADEDRLDKRAARIAATTAVLYIALWEVQKRVRAVTPGACISLLRLQDMGRSPDGEEDARDPNTIIYAISHALERALAREGPIKLQGMTIGARSTGDPRWKISGTLKALVGGRPLQMAADGSLQRAALITYATRPSDSHPSFAGADGHLCMSRTYVWERSGEEHATLRTHGMRSHVIERTEDFGRLQPVFEEISRLRSEGFQHILLLSHHFGTRHIGRAAERHAPHGTLGFLEAVHQSFPDLFLYPLRRDVVPAMRLRLRESAEAGFEVLQFHDHQRMYSIRPSERDSRSVLPIYTFATLAMVTGDDPGRPQSGFCTYFLDQEARLQDLHTAKTAEMNILGLGSGDSVRASLVSILRGVHFLESEKAPTKRTLLPVLDPFDWVSPPRNAAAGEVQVFGARRKGKVLLSLPALLAHVTHVLHKDAQ